MSDTPPSSPSPTSDTFEELAYYSILAISIGIGILQMYRVRAGWITNYGADYFGTIWLYVIFRQGRGPFQKRRAARAVHAAGFVFVGCTASEFAQRVHWLPGVFDPWDIATYAGAVLTALAFERWVRPLVPQEHPST